MNRNKEPCLYITCIKLCAEIEKSIADSTRKYRFTLGERMMRTAIELPVLFKIAYNEKPEKKMTHLKLFTEKLETVKAEIDIAHELGIFSQNKFVRLFSEMESVNRQIYGYINSITKVSDKNMLTDKR